jgi:polyisoprenyl-phosphate glycosyltransferase
VFVDDGSHDATLQTLLRCREHYPQIRIVELSRNFGKEAALTAGCAHATGDAIILMDCDLQDPPELIPELIAKWREGYQVVQALRRNRSTDSWVKRATAKAFYRFMSKIAEISIPENSGDFRLMDRQVVDALLSFPERNRFMKGLMAACGFRCASIHYDRPARAAGHTKFNFWQLWNFALDGITGFSTLPLRVWTYVGAAVAFTAFVYAAWTIAKTLLWGVVTPGYATTLTVMLFLGGVQLIGIGILGEYVGRIVTESKRRPLYLVAALHGFNDAGYSAAVPLGRAAGQRGRR